MVSSCYSTLPTLEKSPALARAFDPFGEDGPDWDEFPNEEECYYDQVQQYPEPDLEASPIEHSGQQAGFVPSDFTDDTTSVNSLILGSPGYEVSQRAVLPNASAARFGGTVPVHRTLGKCVAPLKKRRLRLKQKPLSCYQAKRCPS